MSLPRRPRWPLQWRARHRSTPISPPGDEQNQGHGAPFPPAVLPAELGLVPSSCETNGRGDRARLDGARTLHYQPRDRPPAWKSLAVSASFTRHRPLKGPMGGQKPFARVACPHSQFRANRKASVGTGRQGWRAGRWRRRRQKT